MSLLPALIALSFIHAPIQNNDPLPRKPLLGAQFTPGTTKIAGVVPGGSAEGTLQVGDEITAFGSTNVASPQEVTRFISQSAKKW